jgi:hypothetical protein
VLVNMSREVRPSDAATIDRWLAELGLAATAAGDRDGLSSWDLLLDGRRRAQVRVTLIHERALGAVAWVHYAPPLADNLRKVFRQMLHWNDELPFVKFSLADEDRPMLNAEIAPAALDRDTLGLALARLLAVCDLLYAESASWVDRLGKPAVAGSGDGVRLLERYRAELAELEPRG